MASDNSTQQDKEQSDLDWLLAVKFGLGGFALLMAILWFAVTRTYDGRWEGPLELSTQFGLMKLERDAGILPTTTKRGWDGQHYFHMANDPFFVADSREHIDWPSYRAQRIGPPMIVYFMTHLAGQQCASPLLFYAVHAAITAIGFGVLAAWLVSRGFSPWLSLVWLGSGAAIHSLIFGLPDSAADGMFIVAAVGLLTRRIEVYLPAAMLLVFCRESYAVFTAAVFCLTVFDKIAWIRPTQWLARTSLVMLPGVAMIGWMGYVSYRLKVPLFHGSKVNEWGTLVDWPFFAPLWRWAQFIDARDTKQHVAMVLAVVTIIVIGKYVYDNLGKLPFAAATFPYIVLMTMTGHCIWQEWQAFLRMLGAVILIGIFLLPTVPNKLLRLTLAVNVVLALYFTIRTDFIKQPPVPPLTPVELQSAMTEPPKGLKLSFMRDHTRYRK